MFEEPIPLSESPIYYLELTTSASQDFQDVIYRDMFFGHLDQKHMPERFKSITRRNLKLSDFAITMKLPNYPSYRRWV
jgi:hypothetical protein